MAVGYGAFETSALDEIEVAIDPKRPLSSLSKPQQEKTLVEIARTIADAMAVWTFAGSLQIIDETTEPMEAAIEGRQEVPNRKFSVQSRYAPEEDEISFTGSTATITAEDLKSLPDDDWEVFADLEDSMKRNYDRWKSVRAGLGNAGGMLDGEVDGELKRITKLMCRDLNHIIEFLRQMYKYDLEDRYGRYRYLCSRIGD